MPSTKEALMSSAGFARPGLKCEKCGLPFALSLGAGLVTPRDIENAPDPSAATCPMCKHEGSYPKTAIQLMVSTGSV
jgi:hypothetical protein